MVGAGIAGLATAIALARRGIASTILERRHLVDEEGAGIQIGPNGCKALAALGLLDQLTDVAGHPGAIHLRDGATGRIQASLPLGAAIRARHGAPYLVAHRADLHGLLLARTRNLPTVRIETGWDVEVLARHPDGRYQITSSDGRGEIASVLIGADGLWSAVRRFAFPSLATRPRATGLSAMRTVVQTPPDALPHHADINAWMMPGSHVVLYPLRLGSETAIVVIAPLASEGEGWAFSVDRQSVMTALAHYPPEVRDLAARGTAWRRHQVHRLDALPALGIERIALVGDAAHPMAPYLAQGAVMALEDALVLADAIARHGPTAMALAEFSRARTRRVRRVVRRSRFNGFVYHQSRPISVARNLVLRNTSGARLLAGLDWLYGWQPDAV
ncbi:MAG TPA: FAD-dependent monooxygenase [Hyphomicrobiaceae bacterium]|nr:FAD-dependent monooxygenase [Hyphomicrobiaceae bacterium]